MIGGTMRRARARWMVWSGRCLFAVALVVALALPALATAADPLPVATGAVSISGTSTRIAGALVSAYWYSEAWDEYFWADDATTGADGRFTVYDTPAYGAGDYLLAVSAPGYISQQREVAWAGSTSVTVNVSLVVATRVATGTVCSQGPVGTPTVALADALVSAAWFDEDAGEYLWAGESTSDSKGGYMLWDQMAHGAGSYHFYVSAVGHLPAEADATWQGATPLSLSFYLERLPQFATGKVMDDTTEAPIEGAMVEGYWIDPTDETRYYMGFSYTDKDGVYALYGSYGRGTYEVHAAASGYVSEMVALQWDGGLPLEHIFGLAKPKVLAIGSVVDSTASEPVEGAAVTVYWYRGVDDWVWVADATTDADGLFSVTDDYGHGRGGYQFVVEAPGYDPKTYTTEWGGGTPLQPKISLDRLPMIAEGKVIDAAVQGPVPGALVEAYYYNPASAELTLVGQAVVDDDGYFQIMDNGGRLKGTYEFHATAPGYRKGVYSGTWDSVVPLNFNIELTAVPPLVTGKITQSGSGAAIAGAVVTAMGYDPELGESVVTGTGTTDAGGVYVIHDGLGLGAGEFTLQVEAEGYEGDNDAFRWDGVTTPTMNFSLVRIPPIITGYVRDAATRAPIAGAQVTASWRSAASGLYYWTGDAYSDTQGAFEVEDEEGRGAGTYEFAVSAEGFRSVWWTSSWTGASALVHDFLLTAVTPLATGTVTQSGSGAAIEGARVEASRSDGVGGWVWAGEAYAAADGAYQLHDLLDLGSGTYQFSASATGYQTQTLQRAYSGTTLAVSFSLTPVTPLAEGRVTDAETAAGIEDVWVLATWRNPDTDAWEWAGFALTDGNGDYTLHDANLRGAGDYEFLFEAEGYLPVTLPRTWNGTTTLTHSVALERPPAVATGRVTSQSGGAPIPGAHIDAYWYDADAGEYVLTGVATADGTGAYVVQDGMALGAGDYELAVSALGYRSKSVALGTWDGETTIAQNVVLEPLNAVARGIVTDAETAAPVVGAYVSASWYDAALTEYLWAGDTETAADGRYAVYDEYGHGAGGYQFYADAENYTGAFKTGTWNGTTTLTVNFALQPLELPLTVTSVAGANRIATAVEASKLAFPGGSTYVVIATARNWPDALGGSALAGALGAPILLVEPTSLPAAVATEIGRLDATKAVILGGTGAVSAGVQTSLNALLGAANVSRLAGDNRYTTANAVAQETITRLGSAFEGTAFVATGLDFPDALGASPLAAAGGWPIYLDSPAAGSDTQLVATMKAAGVTKAVILGGTGAVPTALENALKSGLGAANVTRLAGASRYHTAVTVASYGVANLGLGWDKVAVATGQDFPDALAGGVLQARDGSVMLLTHTAYLDTIVRDTLIARRLSILEVRFLGGTGAVSTATRNAVVDALR